MPSQMEKSATKQARLLKNWYSCLFDCYCQTVQWNTLIASPLQFKATVESQLSDPDSYFK